MQQTLRNETLLKLIAVFSRSFFKTGKANITIVKLIFCLIFLEIFASKFWECVTSKKNRVVSNSDVASLFLLDKLKLNVRPFFLPFLNKRNKKFSKKRKFNFLAKRQRWITYYLKGSNQLNRDIQRNYIETCKNLIYSPIVISIYSVSPAT